MISRIRKLAAPYSSRRRIHIDIKSRKLTKKLLHCFDHWGTDRLTVRYHLRETEDEDIEAVSGLLKENKLRYLNLKDFALWDRNAKQLAKGIETTTTLRVLQLRGLNFYIDGRKALLRAVGKNTSLRRLDFCDVLFAAQGLKENGKNEEPPLIHALQSNGHIQHLNLQDINLVHNLNPLLPALKDHPSLRTLILSCNYLRNSGAKSLADALPPGLKKLCLHNNEIKDPGALALAATLKRHPKLRLLDLSNNFLSAQGAKALITAASQSRLQRLNLRGNRIKEEELPQLLQGAHTFKLLINAPRTATFEEYDDFYVDKWEFRQVARHISVDVDVEKEWERYKRASYEDYLKNLQNR